MELFFDYMLRHDLVRQFEKFMLSSNSSLLDFWTRDCHLAEDWLEHPKLMGDKPLVQYRLAVTEDVAGYNGTKEIHQFQRDAYGRAYIPGSSLKGALRTAWLVHLLLHETPVSDKKQRFPWRSGLRQRPHRQRQADPDRSHPDLAPFRCPGRGL